MECCTCVEKAVKLTQGLFEQPWTMQFKKGDTKSVLGQVTGDKRPGFLGSKIPDEVTSDKRSASPTGGSAVSSKRQKTGDGEHVHETTGPEQSVELL